MAYLIRRREEGGYRVRYAKAKEPPAADNCGTGSGGFKPGNKCGLKDGAKKVEPAKGVKAKAPAAPAPSAPKAKAASPSKPAAPSKAPAPSKPSAAKTPTTKTPTTKTPTTKTPTTKAPATSSPATGKLGTVKKSPIPQTPEIDLYDVPSGGTMKVAGVEIKPTGNSYMESTMELLSKDIDLKEIRKAVLSVFVSRQIDPEKRKPKAKKSRPQAADSEKSRRARESASTTDAEVTQYAEAQEFKMAMALGDAIPMPDNEEMDLVLKGKSKKLHGIEMKTMTSRKEHKVQMPASSVAKKLAWSKKTGIPVHTVLLDHRDRFKGGKYKGLHSGHELYYKRGVGTISLGAAYKCKDLDELHRLMDMPEDQLPPAARPVKRD